MTPDADVNVELVPAPPSAHPDADAATQRTIQEPFADVPADVSHDASTRGRVSQSILEHGPSTAAELAERLHLTPAAVRRHLAVLLENGHLVARERRVYGARGRGRPAKVFALTDVGRQGFYQAYDKLAVQAMQYLRETGGEAAVEAFAASMWGELAEGFRVESARQASAFETRAERAPQATAGAFETRAERAPQATAGAFETRAERAPQATEGLAERAPQATHADEPLTEDILNGRVAALVDVLNHEGFVASLHPVKSGQQLCQYHCPVAHVAAEFPELCVAETKLFSQLLGSHVQRIATIAHADGVCTTHIPHPVNRKVSPR